MSLYQLIYVSELNADESVLSAIHSHAVRNNTTRTVTGMLLYANGRFLQILEGERKDVVHTFDRIKEDGRHRNVRLVLEQPIDQRLFSHWNMGFKHLRADDLQARPELGAYFLAPYDVISKDEISALSVLRSFVTT